MTRHTLSEIAKNTAVIGIGYAVGAGTVAALRNGSVLESASIVGIGTGLLIGGLSFFEEKSTGQPGSLKEIMAFTSFFGFVGTSVGSIGSKLFIDNCSCISPLPFVDAIVGGTMVVGTFYCLGLAYRYCQEKINTPEHRPTYGN